MAPKRLSHCCCFTVRTGALILAIFGVTCGIASVAFYSFMLDNDVQIFEELDQYKLKYKELLNEGMIDKDEYYRIVSVIDLMKEYIPAVLTLFIVAGCVTLAKHLMLMFGVLAKKRFFMLPWLVITMAGLVSNVFFGVGYSVIYATNYSLCGGAISLLFVTCVVFIGYYFWQCVFSHYHELKEQAMEKTIEDKRMLVAEEVPPTYEEVVVVKQ